MGRMVDLSPKHLPRLGIIVFPLTVFFDFLAYNRPIITPISRIIVFDIYKQRIVRFSCLNYFGCPNVGWKGLRDFAGCCYSPYIRYRGNDFHHISWLEKMVSHITLGPVHERTPVLLKDHSLSVHIHIDAFTCGLYRSSHTGQRSSCLKEKERGIVVVGRDECHPNRAFPNLAGDIEKAVARDQREKRHEYDE